MSETCKITAKGEREIERERKRDRDRERQTERDRQRQTDRERQSSTNRVENDFAIGVACLSSFSFSFWLSVGRSMAEKAEERFVPVRDGFDGRFFACSGVAKSSSLPAWARE